MTYLELCQKLRQKAGYSGTGPTTVVGQTGDYANIVSWINEAWNELQDMRADWEFMTDTFSLSFTAGDATVTAPTDYRAIKADSVVVSWTPNASKYVPQYLTPNQMLIHKRTYTDTANRPTHYTVAGGTFEVWPTPSENFTISGEYYTLPVDLAADADEPSLPPEYHMGIVYLAMILNGVYDEAMNNIFHANAKWTEYLNKIIRDQLPSLSQTGALA